MRDRLAGRMEQDPSYEAVASAFASTFNDYVRAELKYETDLPYEILAPVVAWNWDQSNGYVDVAETLADALTRNPFLKVHVSSGYYDLATPLFATRYTFDHLGVDPGAGEEHHPGHLHRRPHDVPQPAGLEEVQGRPGPVHPLGRHAEPVGV